jgi:hypothetical protein
MHSTQASPYIYIYPSKIYHFKLLRFSYLHNTSLFPPNIALYLQNSHLPLLEIKHFKKMNFSGYAMGITIKNEYKQ